MHSLHFDISGDDFSVAGLASSNCKKVLKQLGIPNETIRKVSICMYEGEINTIIHGKGGFCDVLITEDNINIKFSDNGPGIPDITRAMEEGFSTATNEARELGFGAGMGLPNIKKYSDDLTITSEVNKGTTVDITVNL